jgi:CheY-like chemotaxis protein
LHALHDHIAARPRIAAYLASELHQCLSAFGKPIPTILITAYPDDAVRERALSAGLIGYLSKPLRRMICSPHPLGSDTRP